MPAQVNRLDANLNRAYATTCDQRLIERRRVPRIAAPFPTILRGVDQSGDRFRIDTVLDNFGAEGLYVRLVRPIELDATVFVVVRFAVGSIPMLAAPGVAARGVVVWVEPQPGAWGIGIRLMRQRFLYAAAQ